MTSRFLIAIAVALVAASTSFAGNIPIVGVTASSTWSTYDVNNLINGAGLSGGLHDNFWHDMWMDNYQDPTPTLVFDLGAVYTLDSTSIWNYNAICCGLDRSVKSLDILVSTDDVLFSLVGSFGLTEGTGDWIPADVLSLSGATGQWVKFHLTGNYGDPDFTGLSEVQFSGNSGQVPEPASGLLLLAGVAGGLIYRRRMAA